ncbi:hypothetical protein LRR81_13430 [Metabacillus sp. GX 13764]|uniref:hypothetical protein n=1 Tax=Metabacillus kandeliae TaxID=2900151 RepID=UPI001E4B378E|nr:hypothetical protein [Metabacillus kandeliae]MCD7035243.1 hypothetical protein [Metabacillus kandeliae]
MGRFSSSFKWLLFTFISMMLGFVLTGFSAMTIGFLITGLIFTAGYLVKEGLAGEEEE